MRYLGEVIGVDEIYGEKIPVYNHRRSVEHLRENLLQFFPGDYELVFFKELNRIHTTSIAIKDLNEDILSEISNYHYLHFKFKTDDNFRYTRDKNKSPMLLVDIDADTEADRNEVINYVLKHYSNRIMWICTKKGVYNKKISKHAWGSHIVLAYEYNTPGYSTVRQDLLRFPVVDKFLTYSMIKNPLYKYYDYIAKEN